VDVKRLIPLIMIIDDSVIDHRDYDYDGIYMEYEMTSMVLIVVVVVMSA
jgi:hypothetical protein